MYLLPSDLQACLETSVIPKIQGHVGKVTVQKETVAVETSGTVSLTRRQPTPEDPLKIVIIHGDPTKPNDILPGGKWDEDDFYTVQRARDALNTLGPKYTFKWLCNHDTLFEDLRSLKRANEVDLVLQLCDEGYMNNSRMELHVVALLDILGIPYTGTGVKLMGMTYDKQCILKVAESIGIPVPKSAFIEEGASLDPKDYGLEFPVFVKPNSTDGSFGKWQIHIFSFINYIKVSPRRVFATTLVK